MIPSSSPVDIAIGRGDLFAIDSQFPAGLDLEANINLRARIVAHQNHRQARRPMRGGEFFHARLQLREDLIAHPFSIQNPGAVSLGDILEKHNRQEGKDQRDSNSSRSARACRGSLVTIPSTSGR